MIDQIDSINIGRATGCSRIVSYKYSKKDLEYFPYKIIIKPFLVDTHKAERKIFANWVRSNFRKEQIMRVLFSEEKLFYIDSVYNVQNNHVWAPGRAETNNNGGVMPRRKFPQKIMV